MSKSIASKSSAFIVGVAAMVYSVSAWAIADNRTIYNLAPGATSPPITIPITNHPVMLTCVQDTVNNVGEGQATIVRSTTDVLLDWVGTDYASGAVQRGYSATAGTHIIFCDFAGLVSIQVNSSTQIQVHNAGSVTYAGVVYMVYY